MYQNIGKAASTQTLSTTQTGQNENKKINLKLQTN